MRMDKFFRSCILGHPLARKGDLPPLAIHARSCLPARSSSFRACFPPFPRAPLSFARILSAACGNLPCSAHALDPLSQLPQLSCFPCDSRAPNRAAPSSAEPSLCPRRRGFQCGRLRCRDTTDGPCRFLRLPESATSLQSVQMVGTRRKARPRCSGWRMLQFLASDDEFFLRLTLVAGLQLSLATRCPLLRSLKRCAQRRVLPSADVGGRPPTFPCNKMPSVEIPEEMHSADMDQGGGFTSLISHGIFPEASSGTAAPTEIVQANDVVPSSVRSNQKRSKNFSVDEDELLVSAWLNVSLDPVQGVDQSRSTYWKRIYEYFHSHKTFHSERTQSSLMNRWSGIQHDCNIFAGCVSRIEARNQSGLSIDDKQANALAMFQAEDKLHRKFPYIHCWKMLKSHAKWADRRKQIETQKTGTKKQKTTTTSSPATLVPLLPACGESELATCTLQRPAGKKKEREKLRRQSSIEALEYLMAKKKEADADKELKKEERFKKAFALEEERISLEKKQFELQRDMYEDTIIRLDFSSMTTEQQQHFLSRQEKIRARRPDY